MAFETPSPIPGIVWPPLAGIGNAHMAHDLPIMLDTQWWPESRLREAQFRQLDALLRHAARHSPYYRELLPACGWNDSMESGTFGLENLPILPRSVLQARGAEVFTDAIPEGHGDVHQLQTSGSTGRLVVVRKTSIIGHLFNVLTVRQAFWHSRNLMSRIAVIRYFHDTRISENPDGRVSNDWGPPFSGLYPTGQAALLDIRHDIQIQAAWLHRQQPTYLLTFPSNLRALAEIFRDRGWTLPDLLGMQTLSETLSPETRELAESVFGAPISDMYSAQEVGYIALQGPEGTHYLVQSENVIVEVLDDQGRPCAQGETGRIVVTDLHNFATPLIRYDIGDLGEVGPPCPSGRGLPVISKIGGRVRNLVSTPDGRRYWPAVPLDVFRNLAPVKQFQLVQKSLSLIEARLVVARPLSGDEEQMVGRMIQEGLSYPFNIRLTYLDALPRDPVNGKFEDFKSEILTA